MIKDVCDIQSATLYAVMASLSRGECVRGRGVSNRSRTGEACGRARHAGPAPEALDLVVFRAVVLDSLKVEQRVDRCTRAGRVRV